MTPLEWATFVLVVMLILLLIALGVMMVVLAIKARQVGQKVDRILENVEETTSNIKAPVKLISSGLLGLVVKNTISKVAKKIINKR